MYANRTTAAWENAELQMNIEPFPLQTRNVTKWLGKDPYMAGRRDGEVEIGACAMGQSEAGGTDIGPLERIQPRRPVEQVLATRAQLNLLG